MNFEPTSLIVVAVFLIVILGAGYGLKTRQGSGINDHPDANTQDPARDPEAEGVEPMEESDRPDSTLFDQRGKS